MAIDKRINYRGGGKYRGGTSRSSRSYGPPGSSSRQSAPTHQPSRGPSGPPSVLNPPTKKKTTVTTGGPPSVLNPPTKKKTTTWTPGAGKPTHIPKTTKRRTPPGGIKSGDWKKHATRVMQMKKNMLGNIPKYSHLVGGYDWQKQTGSNPILNAYLASGWQGLQEMSRGIGKYLTGDPGAIGDAWSKWNKEATGNIEGILAASTMPALQNVDTQTWDKVYGNTVYGDALLANGGLVNLYRYGGFV